MEINQLGILPVMRDFEPRLYHSNLCRTNSIDFHLDNSQSFNNDIKSNIVNVIETLITKFSKKNIDLFVRFYVIGETSELLLKRGVSAEDDISKLMFDLKIAYIYQMHAGDNRTVLKLKNLPTIRQNDFDHLSIIFTDGIGNGSEKGKENLFNTFEEAIDVCYKHIVVDVSKNINHRTIYGQSLDDFLDDINSINYLPCNELANKDFRVNIVPNPAYDWIELSTNGTLGGDINKELIITLHCLEGKVTHQLKTSALGLESLRINIEHLAQGMYIVKISNAEFLISNTTFVKN
jgi:hypothetical protein